MLKLPYVWFGGKSNIANVIWYFLAADGDKLAFNRGPARYIEPFVGGNGFLLSVPPSKQRVEVINDLDGLVANFWRAVRDDPVTVAYHAEWPPTHHDFLARRIYVHNWIKNSETSERLQGDPFYYDPVIAGYWAWSIAYGIGSPFANDGMWTAINGRLAVDPERKSLHATRPSVKPSGIGKPALRTTGTNKLHDPKLTEDTFRHPTELVRLYTYNNTAVITTHHDYIDDLWQRISDYYEHRFGYHGELNPYILAWLYAIQARMKYVTVLANDWKSVIRPAMLNIEKCGKTEYTAVFLDPPYRKSMRDATIYRTDFIQDDLTEDIVAWCKQYSDHPKIRIVLTGFTGEGYEELCEIGWKEYHWPKKLRYTRGGWSLLNNDHQMDKDRIWVSPQCPQPDQEELDRLNEMLLMYDNDTSDNSE